MLLKELASKLMLSHIDGEPETLISGIQSDHRKVKEGDLFICLPGHMDDGHRYAAQAVANGAAALVVQTHVDVDIPKLVVKDSRYAMAIIANHYFGYPSHEMKLIGITGTNGKTTTTYLLEKIFKDQGHATGLMGTIQMKIGNNSHEVKNTTQEALELHRNLRKMREVETEFCMMEVSSHALQLGRVIGCQFRTAVFTNLTQDHLDYHKTMDNYKEAKGLLFSRMGNTFHPNGFLQYAVLNADDAASEYYSKITAAQVITYGIDQEADVRASEITMGSQGTQFKVTSFAGEMMLHLQMVGKFSVYNALGAIAASLVEGVPLLQIKNSLEEVKGVSGRFEVIHEGQSFLVIVDYAHTPDSLENVLKTIRDFCEGDVYCVFGCGGDRDRTKRPIMGSIAAKYSDYLIVTSDNPRTEDPASILKDVEQGLIHEQFAKDRYQLVLDRKSAIEKAVEMASPKDVILIAGKGHETYQEINGERFDFDDRVIAKNAIRSLQK